MDLSSIVTTQTQKPPTIFLYGVEGIGKTTFASRAPAPVFIQTEDGLGRLSVPHFPLAESTSDVVGAIAALADGGHNYKTVVLDSVDWLESLVWKDLDKLPDSQLAFGKGYALAADAIRDVLRGLTYLRDRLGMCAIVLGHSQIKHYKSPETPDYDRYCPKLQDRSSALVREWCDCLLFANYQVSSRDGKGVTSGERFIYTEEKPGHLAKNRFGLPERLPLDWDAFSEAFSNSFTK